MNSQGQGGQTPTGGWGRELGCLHGSRHVRAAGARPARLHGSRRVSPGAAAPGAALGPGPCGHPDPACEDAAGKGRRGSGPPG